jgi:hypothetical protein
VSKCSSGTWGTARAAHWHAGPGPGSTALAGCGGLLELLYVKHVPGSTALAGRGGPLELLSNHLVVYIGKNAHYGAKLQGALAHRDIRLQEAWAPQRDANVQHLLNDISPIKFVL